MTGRKLIAGGCLPTLLVLGTLVPAAVQAADAIPNKVQFNRDIRPILSDNCFQCHGPDKSQRKAKLRLDNEADPLADRGGYRAIEAGQPAKSEMILRITSKDSKERMPPAAKGQKLTGRQIELMRRWIEQGAKWQKHWSLIAPQRPELPRVKTAGWPKNAVDHFHSVRAGSHRFVTRIYIPGQPA